MKINPPLLSQLSQLVRNVREQIAPQMRANENETQPSILLTVGCDATGAFVFQTGDGSNNDELAKMPARANVTIYRDSDSQDLARHLQHQLTTSLPESARKSASAFQD